MKQQDLSVVQVSNLNASHTEHWERWRRRGFLTENEHWMMKRAGGQHAEMKRQPYHWQGMACDADWRKTSNRC